MGLKKNILRVLSTNFLTAISGIIIGFIVPAVLSLDSYAYVKTYSLYISYIGFLHLGFVDGMYIKYGGKSESQISKGIFKYEHKIFMMIQLVMTGIFLIISLVTKDLIVILMMLSIVPINTCAFHKIFYQAIGQFRKYASANYIYIGIYLTTNIILVFLMKSNNYIFYIITSLIANIIVFIRLEISFYKEYKNIKIIEDKNVCKNIKVGFIILIANLGVLLFYGMDRWFVKLYFNNEDFAYYSFAISMLSIINILISAVSMTFYNYLAKGEDEEKIKILKNYFLIVGGIASLAYFGLSLIVNIFLKKYIPSLSIIAISFATYPYMIVINALYVNLYKARKNEKKYLKVVVAMLLVAALYNFIAVNISNNSICIAIATALSFITWYIYSSRDFKYLKIKVKEVIYLVTLFISFVYTSHLNNYFIGGIVYLIILTTLVLLLFRFESKVMIEFLKGKKNKI